MTSDAYRLRVRKLEGKRAQRIPDVGGWITLKCIMHTQRTNNNKNRILFVGYANHALFRKERERTATKRHRITISCAYFWRFQVLPLRILRPFCDGPG
jgi:hypothetical protein